MEEHNTVPADCEQLQTNDAGTKEIHTKPDGQKTLVKRLIRTALAYFAHICMGLLSGLGGPAFLDLLLITNADVETGSIFFSTHYLGILISSTGAGVLYDRYPSEPIMMAALLACGAFNAAVPLCRHIGVMAFVNCLKGMGLGVVFVGASVIIQNTWDQKSAGPFQQALHFFFGVGGVLAPFLVRPFLAPRIYLDTVTIGNSSIFNVTNYTQISETQDQNVVYGTTRVQYGFFIVSVINVFSAFTLLGFFLADRRSADRACADAKSQNEKMLPVPKPSRISRPVRILFLAAIAIYYIFIVAPETLFQNFIMTFVVKHLNWDKVTGTQITSVYWLAFSFGRFSGIIAARLLTPGKIITMDFVALTAATITLLLGAEKYSIIVWLMSIVHGVFVGPLFAAGVTYADYYMMRVTGKVYSLIFVSAVTGAFSNPPILGALIQNYSAKWFAYLAVILSGIQWLVLIVFTVLTRKWGRAGPGGKETKTKICTSCNFKRS